MYQKHKVKRLSHRQLRNLEAGLPILIKKHTGDEESHSVNFGKPHHLMLNQEQSYKLNNAHNRGRAARIKFGSEQIKHHRGSGLFNRAKEMYHKYKDNPIVKAVVGEIRRKLHEGVAKLHRKGAKRDLPPELINPIANYVHEQVATYEPEMPEKEEHQGEGMRRRRKVKSKAVKHSLAGTPAMMKKMAKLRAMRGKSVKSGKGAMSRSRYPKDGAGIFGAVGNFVANKVASKIPIVGDIAAPLLSKGATYLGEKVDAKLGTGMKKRGRPRKYHKGSALRPAGY
jgi:hypothetical protein